MEQLELVAHAHEFDEGILRRHSSRQDVIEEPRIGGSEACRIPSKNTEEKTTAGEDDCTAHAQTSIATNVPNHADPQQPNSGVHMEEGLEVAKDRGWAAWQFLLASAAIEFMVWGAAYGYGSFQDYHQHNPASPFHNSSLTATSSVGTLLLGGQHFIPLISVGLYSTFPSLVKKFSIVCVIGSSLALLIASFSNSVALLVVFQGILLGIFGGNLFTVTILWLPNWWDKRRGFATACIFGGSAMGGIVWPIIFTQLLENVGFRWTLRVLALLQLVVCGAAVLALFPGAKLSPVTKPIHWKGIIPGFPRSLLSVLTVLNAIALTTQTTAWYSISLNISNYATSMGFNSATSTGILSAFNASATITYPVLGYVIDRFPYPLIMATSTTLCAIFTLLVFGFAGSSLTKIVLFVVFFGISGGGFASFLTPVSRDIPNKSHSHEFSLRFLYLVFIRGVAAMLGPLIAVQFYPDHLGGESTYGSFGFTGFIAFVAAVLLISTSASVSIFLYKKYVLPRRERERAKSLSITPQNEANNNFESITNANVTPSAPNPA